MAKKDKPQNSSGEGSKGKKPESDDFDKTVVDFDIRQLKEGFDETVIVRAPLEEDSDLHNTAFFDEEKTGAHVEEELAKQRPKEKPAPKPSKAREEAKPPAKAKAPAAPSAKPQPEQVSLLHDELEPPA